MKLRKILLEITFDRALAVLGLSKDDLTPETIKTAFRKASIKAHPDKGGSNEAMRDVIDAKEFLEKQSFATSTAYDQKKYNEQEFKLAVSVLEQLKSKIDLGAFESYFKSIYGEPFTSKILRESPKAYSRYVEYISLAIEFSNDSREILFLVEFSCLMSGVTKTGSLGSGVGNISYPLGVTAYGFFNNKRLKLSQTNYTRTQNHDILTHPEIAFPKPKLEKFKTTSSAKVFKKQDMTTYLSNKLGLSWDGQDARIKLLENITLVFARGTFMKTPYWSINLYQNHKGVAGMSYVTLAETIETAQTIEEMLKKVKSLPDGESIKRYIIDRTKELRNTKV